MEMGKCQAKYSRTESCGASGRGRATVGTVPGPRPRKGRACPATRNVSIATPLVR